MLCAKLFPSPECDDEDSESSTLVRFFVTQICSANISSTLNASQYVICMNKTILYRLVYCFSSQYIMYLVLTCSSTETFRTFHKNSIIAIANAILTPIPSTRKTPPTLASASSEEAESTKLVS